MSSPVSKAEVRADLVLLEDWLGLYFDGTCVYQGHSLHIARFLQLLSEHGYVRVASHHLWSPTDEYERFVQDGPGRLPETFSQMDGCLT